MFSRIVPPTLRGVTERPAHYTVSEVAALLRRNRGTVETWIIANADAAKERSHVVVGGESVPVLRIGGRWHVVADALDAALRGESVA